jgi:hypothetical protein
LDKAAGQALDQQRLRRLREGLEQLIEILGEPPQ